MVISHCSLTQAGLTKIASFSCQNLTQKIRLYSLSPQLSNDLSKLYEVLQQQKRSYEGNLSKLSQDIQLKPYLLRQGSTFKFISKEQALQMQGFDLAISPDQNNDLTQFHDHLTDWMGVLGKEVIPEEILKSLVQQTYPLTSLEFLGSLTESLTFFVTGSILTCDEALLPNLKCYTINRDSQESFTHNLCDEERNKICAMIWQAIFLQLQQHESLPQTQVKSYLTYALSLLNHQSFKQTITSLQKIELISLLSPFMDAGPSLYLAQDLSLESIDHSSLIGTLTQWICVLREKEIPEELLRTVFRSSYPKLPLITLLEALDQMVELQLLQDSSSFPHLKCYQMDISLQEDEFQHLSPEQQEKSCLITWKGIDHHIQELRQDNSLHQEELNLYLDHAILLLTQHPFKQRLSQEAVTPIPALPDSLTHEQKFLQNILSQAVQVLKDFPSTIQQHEKKLMKARAMKDRKEEGISYGDLGSAYDELGDHQQAITHHLKQLAIAESLGDQQGKIMGSGNLGNAYFALKEFDQAVVHYQICLQLAQDIQEHSIAAVAYLNLGKTYQALQDPLQAEICYNESLALSRAIQDEVLKKMALSQLERVQQPLDELPETEEELKHYLHLAQKENDYSAQGRAHAYLGNLYADLKKYTEAIDSYEKALVIAQKLQCVKDEIKIYKSLGHSHYALNQYAQAMDCYKKCLSIAIKCENHTVVGQTYGHLGNLYMALKQYDNALESYEICLQKAKTISHNEMQIEAQLSLNNLHMYLGKYPELIAYYQENLSHAEKKKDLASEGVAHRHLGQLYQNSKNHENAINSYHKALKIANELNNYVGEKKAYYHLGKSYHALEKYEQAIEFHAKYAVMAIRLGNLDAEGKSYLHQGKAYEALNDYPNAIEFYNRYLKISQQLQNLSKTATAYEHLSTAYFHFGDYHIALDYNEKYLQIAHETQDIAMQGTAYTNLGALYAAIHDEKGPKFLEEALSIAQQVKDRLKEEIIYNNLGVFYKNLCDFDKAISYYKQSLTIAQELKNRERESEIYRNLGDTHSKLGEYQLALNYFETAFTMHETEHQKKQHEATFFHDMGTVYQTQGDSTKALNYFENALKSAQGCHDRLGEMCARNSLGSIYKELGNNAKTLIEDQQKIKTITQNQQVPSQKLKDATLPPTPEDFYQKAFIHYNESLKISIDTKDKLTEGKIRANLGTLYGALTQLDQDLENSKHYLKTAEDFQDHMNIGMAHHNLGVIYQRLQDVFQAEAHYRHAIDALSSLEHKTKKSQWKVSLFENWSKPYLALEQLLIYKDIEALEISDARRSRALSSLISQKLTLEEKSLFNSGLTYLQMRELATTLKTTFIVYSLLNADPAKIQFKAWVISSHQEKPDSIHMVTTPDDEIGEFNIDIPNEDFLMQSNIFRKFPYQTEINRPLRNQKQPGQFFNERLSAWYDLFIAPLAQHLPSQTSGDTLTIIPDGFLAHLPFGAFYNVKDKTHLIEHYPISISPSIGALSLLNQYPKVFSDHSLLVGNPQSHPDDQDSSLPKADDEIQCLTDLLTKKSPIHPATPMRGKEATVSQVVEQAPQARFIHIACHGVAGKKPTNNPDSIFEGFFKLAFVDEKTPHQLHAEDVASMALKADLVFMSACHLGRGNLKQEGSIGPIWSFLGAGARSTIASYWPLPDSDITVKIVEIFYTHLFGIDTPKLDKARALQQAILTVMGMENPSTKAKVKDSPRQWAAFFLSGLTE